ncbi:alpha/beta hydrolase fold family protein [Paraburkholderia xenovorans LB400]|uniref:Lipase/esterase n=1 Tax=Paraburkholderia xenovorans (strain LB400) TaxID=266265 RepID=Q13G75_PARXL|nr:alpha/beta hydrolase [Paraburkholderia xenovorans]ABE36914.1 Putative lipase/esterase [Paraburkholderia xenovorans LB400]AIP34433.1 alpha/beta hydrolase fold family protein [Paraburkholderia xenovorans LB400]
MKLLIVSALGVATSIAFATSGAHAQRAPASVNDGIATVVAKRQQSLVGTRDFIDRRAAFEKLMAQVPVPDGVTIHHVDANGVPGKWVSLNHARVSGTHGRRVILYLHGGGFYSGSSNSHRALAATLARDAGADVLLPDYRRMPEARYPAQIDDAVTSYEWLLKQGYFASDIAVAGESAGGNLVLELALRLRAAHRPLPSSLVAMSPIMDLTASGDSTRTLASLDPVLTRAGLLDVTKVYMQGADPRSPDASPLFADLHGLPPLLLQVGAREILLDDSLRIARVAALDDVAVSVEVWPGMVHQWQLFPDVVPEARRALRNCAEFIDAHMARVATTQ